MKFVDSALVAYANDKDKLGFAEAHAMRYLTLNHLYQSTEFEGWLVSAKHTAQTGVELARRSNNPKALGISLFHLAEVQEDLKDYNTALLSYREALTALGQSTGNIAYMENIKNHMEICAYKNGDEGAIERAEEALDVLQREYDGGEYNRKVWISGGYLRIANALRQSDSELAKEYLEKARVYIESHPELKLRKKQLEKLASTFV